MTHSHKADTTEQARSEIEKIKEMLLSTKFDGIWLSSMIKVNGRETGPVPKTVFEAYSALRQYEKDDPVKALAAFYSKFVVAVRPEFEHSSRNEKTRRFYQRMADKNVTAIFPKNSEAVKSFNDHLEFEVQKTTLEKSPEQKDFVAFQAKVNHEIMNIQSMSQQLNLFLKLMPLVNEKTRKILQDDFMFLLQVIERMKTANISSDVDLYAKDALIILDNILAQAHHKNLKTNITHIKNSIEQFKEHHTELMTDLHDKEKALYLRSALQVASIAMGSHLIQHSYLHSHAANIMEFGLGIGLAKAADKEKIGQKIDDPALQHIHAVNKANSLSDTYANVTNTLSQPETKDNLVAKGGLAMSVALFPALAVPVAVTSAIYNTGGVAFNFYTEKSQLAAAQKAAKETRAKHQKEMENYLSRSQEKTSTDAPSNKSPRRSS